MGTLKQKRLAQEIVNDLNNPIPQTGKELLANVGYAEGLLKQPGRIIDTPGVKEELEALGFTEHNADTVVASILQHGEKEETRLKAADLIYKRKGSYAAEKSIALNVNIQSDPKQLSKLKPIRDKYEQELFDAIANDGLNPG